MSMYVSMYSCVHNVVTSRALAYLRKKYYALVELL